jgi:hypothetical protein
MDAPEKTRKDTVMLHFEVLFKHWIDGGEPRKTSDRIA